MNVKKSTKESENTMTRWPTSNMIALNPKDPKNDRKCITYEIDEKKESLLKIFVKKEKEGKSNIKRKKKENRTKISRKNKNRKIVVAGINRNIELLTGIFQTQLYSCLTTTPARAVD